MKEEVTFSHDTLYVSAKKILNKQCTLFILPENLAHGIHMQYSLDSQPTDKINEKILDRSKLKTFAHNKLKLT